MLSKIPFPLSYYELTSLNFPWPNTLLRALSESPAFEEISYKRETARAHKPFHRNNVRLALDKNQTFSIWAKAHQLNH